jgi:hypothetical protein
MHKFGCLAINCLERWPEMRFVMIDRYHIVWLEVECRCTLHSGYTDGHMQVQSVGCAREKNFIWNFDLCFYLYHLGEC